jgi:hypothetical protein
VLYASGKKTFTSDEKAAGRHRLWTVLRARRHAAGRCRLRLTSKKTCASGKKTFGVVLRARRHAAQEDFCFGQEDFQSMLLIGADLNGGFASGKGDCCFRQEDFRSMLLVGADLHGLLLGAAELPFTCPFQNFASLRGAWPKPACCAEHCPHPGLGKFQNFTSLRGAWPKPACCAEHGPHPSLGITQAQSTSIIG